jgi:hypothetical protein
MELFILLLVVIGVHWFEYNRSIQEYTISQVPVTELASVMGEKTPIMFEIGALPWRPEVLTKSSVLVDGLSTTKWLETTNPIQNNEELAMDLEMTTGLSELDSARRLWWLPGMFNTKVDYFKHEVLGLSWVTAEREWIGCSAGEPLLIWLVHSRYRQYLPVTVDDPWNLTIENAPYIGRVQYIEVRVQPGWTLGIPTHWGYAIQCKEPSWSWTSEQHSVLSLAINIVGAMILKKIEDYEDLNQ